MRARYYDPEVGRFVNEDPGQYGQNWYLYCENNPVNFWDENGKEPTTTIKRLDALINFIWFIITIAGFTGLFIAALHGVEMKSIPVLIAAFIRGAAMTGGIGIALLATFGLVATVALIGITIALKSYIYAYEMGLLDD